MAKAGLEPAVGSKGNCFDNAAVESFLGILKAEYFQLEKADSIDALEVGVHDYSTTTTTSVSSSGCRGSAR